jgi:hypothetical protein
LWESENGLAATRTRFTVVLVTRTPPMKEPNVADPLSTETKPSADLQQLIQELVDFSELARLTRMWEIGWVVEDHDGEGDPTAIIRLIERLRQMLPNDFVLSDDEDSPRLLEEAILAAYRQSGSFDGDNIRLAVTEPTLFGQASLETNVNAADSPISLVVRASDGAETERVVLSANDPYYADLNEFLEGVVDDLYEE